MYCLEEGLAIEPGSTSLQAFWCGDSGFRGCILRSSFTKLGFSVIIPPSPPRSGTGKLPKRGTMFSVARVSRFLLDRGLRELWEIDRKWGVSSRARGDIDFAAIANDTVLIAEAKTRLIVRSLKMHGIRYARLMLQYHLDEPGRALAAWEELVDAGIVKPVARGGYDNPASIAELTRSVAGFHLSHSGSTRYTRIVVGVATMCYSKLFLEDIGSYVSNVSFYLRKAGLPVLGGVVFLVYPSSLEGVPPTVCIECFGDQCGFLGFDSPRRTSVFGSGCPGYRGCSECRYRSICLRSCPTSASDYGFAGKCTSSVNS